MQRKSRGDFLLIGVLPLAIGLFVLEHQAPVSQGWHQVLQGLIMLLAIALLGFWVWLNRQALAEEEVEPPEKPEETTGSSLTPVQAHYRQVMKRYGK